MKNKLKVYPRMIRTDDNKAPLWKGFNYGHFTDQLINDDIETFHHLYLVSNESVNRPIKMDDWYIYNNDVYKSCRGTVLAESMNKEILNISTRLKIEASTDGALGLPFIPESFVKEWVEKQGEIESLYIQIREDGSICTVSPSGRTQPDYNKREVIILSTKDSFTREEVNELLEALEAVISVSDRNTDIYNKAKAVIKKVKGE